MILDLGERAALVALLRRALDDALPAGPAPGAVEGGPGQAGTAGAGRAAAADPLRADAKGRARAAPMNAYRGPPMTLGNAAAAGVRFVVWCDLCGHQVDLEPADQAACCGAALSVQQWRTRLVCGACGSRRVSMVVAGTERYPAGPG